MALEEQNKGKDGTAKRTWQQELVLYLRDLIRTLAIILVLFLVVFRVNVVSGDSMYGTLYDGDYLLCLGNLFYSDPAYGDIIVISKDSFDNGAPIIKRVIATEGQLVDIDFENGIVYVNGQRLHEDYIHSPTTVAEGVQFPIQVDEGCVFVMGDNRGVSRDSRSPEIGLIDEREILGKALYLFLPGTHHGQFERDYDRAGEVK